jgi:hypothetical protein
MKNSRDTFIYQHNKHTNMSLSKSFKDVCLGAISKDIEDSNQTMSTTYSTFKVTTFDRFVTECLNHTSKKCSSLKEIRDVKTTKVKGDIFELFCKAYLKNIKYAKSNCKKYDKVWLLKEIPANVLEILGMNTVRDFGIDIVCMRWTNSKSREVEDYNAKDALYSAVQCKFKKPKEGLVPGTWIPYNCVNWKTLSTFMTLTSRTNNNNWERIIVMTNAKYVRRQGVKTAKDLSYCYGTFKKLKTMDLIELSNIIDTAIDDPSKEDNVIVFKTKGYSLIDENPVEPEPKPKVVASKPKKFPGKGKSLLD